MLPFDILPDFLPVLPSVPEGGMLFYLETEALLRGRRHQNTFWMTFNGGEKTVFNFFQDITLNVINRLAVLQSWDVQYFGYWFVKLFPPPYVIMFVPYPIFGFWTEPACQNKELACVNFWTEQQGHRGRARKFLFGMPASWIEGTDLNAEGSTRIYSHMATWEQLFMIETEESGYTMGLMHRYVDGSYHSPLNPINYWPFNRFRIRWPLVKHMHYAASIRNRHV